MGLTTKQILQGVKNWTQGKVDDIANGGTIPALAYNLEAWADQKAIATPDTYTDAVRTTGGDIPVETSAGSKLESIKPVVGSKWTAKMLFNGSYNMLNAAKWGAANSQPYVGGGGSNFVYFLVPKLTLGTFGTADENNGLLFTDSEGVNVQPATVYYKPLGSSVPSSATDGTAVTPTSVSYDGKTFKTYETPDEGWLIVPKTIYDNDVCAHIAWEDWYDKHVSLNEPSTNPEAVVGALMLEAFLALIQSDKYLRAVNETVNDHIIFGETSATGVKMVGELSVAANAWTNAATGESDSQGNALYRHSTTVSGIKQGGAASLSDGTPMTIVGTTASYVDTNATADASVVYYELPSTTTIEKAYTDSVFSGSTIDAETGIMPINDCSIEAQVGMDGEANITVKYAKNIVDQVAINATVDVPQIKRQVENHEERIGELEDTAVRTGSYDASVAVGLADNFKGDTTVEAEFYKRKTGGTQSVGSGIAAIKEVRGKSIVWNQLVDANTTEVATISGRKYLTKINGVKSIITSTGAAITINDASVDQVFNLTLMTLSNITVAEFEKMFPLDHYDYNTGTIIPFAGQNLVTIGKNQYNPISGKANLLGGMTYQISGTYTSATIDEVAVTLDSNSCFTTTKDCVLEITGGNDTDTFVGLYNGETNTFEPYEKHTLPLDPSQWRDKQGNLVFPYGGMHGVGTAYDYAKVDADGYIRKAMRVFEQVDFGNENWSYVPSLGRSIFRINTLAQTYMFSIKTNTTLYTIQNQGQTMVDKSIQFNTPTTLSVCNNDYSNVADFKAAMQGVYLIYTLAEPVEVELATPIYAKYLVDKDGTEEITPANGTTPYTTPANLSILYAMDARGEIKNLPKNYLSKESAENMLNAMQSAGIIAGYTMTYSNGQYIFTFTQPSA